MAEKTTENVEAFNEYWKDWKDSNDQKTKNLDYLENLLHEKGFGDTHKRAERIIEAVGEGNEWRIRDIVDAFTE